MVANGVAKRKMTRKVTLISSESQIAAPGPPERELGSPETSSEV